MLQALVPVRLKAFLHDLASRKSELQALQNSCGLTGSFKGNLFFKRAFPLPFRYSIRLGKIKGLKGLTEVLDCSDFFIPSCLAASPVCSLRHAKDGLTGQHLPVENSRMQTSVTLSSCSKFPILKSA